MEHTEGSAALERAEGDDGVDPRIAIWKLLVETDLLIRSMTKPLVRTTFVALRLRPSCQSMCRIATATSSSSHQTSVQDRAPCSHPPRIWVPFCHRCERELAIGLSPPESRSCVICLRHTVVVVVIVLVVVVVVVRSSVVHWFTNCLTYSLYRNDWLWP